MPVYELSRLTALAAALLLAAPVHAQPGGGAENVVLAVPNVALTFAPGYLAEDLGLFARHELNVKSVVITGIGSANAVISGSADFAQISGATSTRAAARGQRLLGIVSNARPTDHPDRFAQGDRGSGRLRSQGDARAARAAHALPHHRGLIPSIPSSTPMRCCWRAAPATVPTISASLQWRRTAPSRRSRRARSTDSPCRCRGPLQAAGGHAPS